MARKSIGERRHVILPKPQNERLDALAKSTGLTPSEHIRRAIDAYFRLLEAAAQRKTATK